MPPAEAIKKLTKQHQDLEARIDDLEQHGPRGSICVFGVPEDFPGTTDDKILSICNENLKLDPKLSIEDIEVSHRLGKEPPQPREGETRSDPKRPIIVKFSSRRTKGRVMESCKLLKTNPPKDSDGEPLKHSRLLPMYNARFILWPSSLSSIRKKLVNGQCRK